MYKFGEYEGHPIDHRTFGGYVVASDFGTYIKGHYMSDIAERIGGDKAFDSANQRATEHRERFCEKDNMED